MRIYSKIPTIAAIVVSIAVLLFSGDANRQLLVPVLLVVNLTFFTWNRLSRYGTLPVFDVGFICILGTCFYVALPIIGYMLAGNRFDVYADSRLYFYQPDSSELASFHWFHVVYMASLVAAYLGFRGYLRRRAGNTAYRDDHGLPEPTVSISLVHATVIVFAVLLAYLLVLELLTGFTYNQNYSEMAKTYVAGEDVALPGFVGQISHYLNGMYFIAKLAILFFVVRRAGKSARWRLALFGWLALELLFTWVRFGARDRMVMLLIAAAMFYHRFVHPLSRRFLIAAGAVVLAGFLYFGAVRGGLDTSSESILTSRNETQSLLGTGYDIYKKQQSDALPDIPWQIYINDVIRLLPPQSLLPFEKIAAAEWYMNTQIYRTKFRRPTGMMWGVVPQSLIGLGWIELIIRGLFLGGLLAYVHRWVEKSGHSFFYSLFYVWLGTKIYYCYRDTTLSPLVYVVYEVIPAVVAIKLVATLISRRHAKRARIPRTV